MSVWRRLANVARGKALTWQRDPAPRALDPDELDAVVRPTPAPAAEVPGPDAPEGSEPPPVPEPALPRPRRL